MGHIVFPAAAVPVLAGSCLLSAIGAVRQPAAKPREAASKHQNPRARR